MRLTIALLLLTLFGFAWLACEVPLAQTESEPSTQTAWRRTRYGWERASWITTQQPASRPEIHPALVGIVELLFVAAALIAFSEKPPRRQRRHKQRRHKT